MARPVTDRQWQDAVDAAHAIMTMEVGRIYELLHDMPAIDFEECFRILEEGRERGITPTNDVDELHNAAAALVERIDTQMPALSTNNWLGAPLLRLRNALRQRRKGEMTSYAHRKVS
jgi:hypothetical protein